MQEYYFLFALALIWTVFATVQDLRTREVANWLNFSLIAFALAYRAFYSIATQNYNFLIFGLLGFAIFFALGHAFYYGKAFAGGDAKLLMGYGAILPYQSYSNLLSITILFLFFLFLTGAIYSLLYSAGILAKNKTKFTKEFKKRTKKHKNLLTLSLVLLAISIIFSIINPIMFSVTLLLLIPLIYLYTISIDKCMVKLVPPSKLTEGDWIEQNVKIGKTTIKKSVHGLSLKEIKLLKKYKKSILIKEGIPFTPAFLITLMIMALFFLTSKLPLPFSFLF